MTWNPDWIPTHSPPTLEYRMVRDEHEPEFVASCLISKNTHFKSYVLTFAPEILVHCNIGLQCLEM